MHNVRAVQHAKHEYDVVHVRITPSPWGMGADCKWFYPVYVACVELDLTVFVHVEVPGPWPTSHQNPELLDKVALTLPDLWIVAHHIGDPWTDVSVRLAARHPNFYICTSDGSPSTTRASC